MVMKKITLLVALFALSAFNSIHSQEISMSNILELAAPIVELIEVENDQEIVRMEFDILSSSASSKITMRTLYSGWTYGICAFGDYRISDLDIKVYKDMDGEPVLLKKDDDASDVAVVTIEPSSTGSSEALYPAW